MDNQRLLQSLIEATKQRDELLAACEHLLLSADASWEINRGGHDWAEACEEARSAIAKVKKAIRTLDPKDHRDPRWTPTLEEAAKLRAEVERLRGALELIVGDHEFCGEEWGDRREAWIETARAALAKAEETNHTQVMRCGATLKSTIKAFRCEKGEGHDGGHRAEHHVWSDAEAPEPEYWTRLEHQAAIQLHPVFVRDMLADPRLIGQVGEDWPDGVAADAVNHARALIVRLKGETE